MNNKRLMFLLAAVAGLFLFVGCQKQAAQPGENTVSPEGVAAPDPMQEEQLSTEDMLKYQTQMSEIVKTGELAKCTEIKSRTFFNSCNVHILANRAVREYKAEICQEGVNTDIQRGCAVCYQQMIDRLKKEADEQPLIKPADETAPAGEGEDEAAAETETEL